MNTEFSSAIKQIAAERGIEISEILEAVAQAIKSAFKNIYSEEDSSSLQVDIDTEAATISVYADKKVVDHVSNDATQISLENAKKLNSKLKIGDHVLVEITSSGDFGRIAAQAAKQIILQKIKEAEQDSMVRQFQSQIGTVDTAIIQRMDREGNVICEIHRAIAKLPPEEQIASEYYQSGAPLKVYLKTVWQDAKGKTMIVSRSDPNFLRALFEMEVPEIASGTVEIVSIAREAGSRSKVAVKSNAQGVDPIGACVGQRGSRINAITNELKTNRGEEKIDIIPWDEDKKTFLANAIRPAEALEVRIVDEDEKQALIVVDDEYLSLAIGREGQNVRLAAKLTGWKIDIQGKQGYEAGGKLSKFEQDAGVKPAVVSKPKAKKEEVAQSELAGLGLSTRIVSSLEKLEISTAEDLKAKIESGEKLAGIGPKAVEEIKAALNI